MLYLWRIAAWGSRANIPKMDMEDSEEFGRVGAAWASALQVGSYSDRYVYRMYFIGIAFISGEVLVLGIGVGSVDGLPAWELCGFLLTTMRQREWKLEVGGTKGRRWPPEQTRCRKN